jgi:hypothetical protein
MTVVLASLPLTCRRAQVFARVASRRVWAVGPAQAAPAKLSRVNLCNRFLRHAHRPPAPSSFFRWVEFALHFGERANVNFEKEARMKPCPVNDNAQDEQSPKQDIYARITAKIVAALEDGV